MKTQGQRVPGSRAGHMRRIIIVTGTPGVGKTRLAKKIAAERKALLIDVNGIVRGKRLFSRVESDGTLVAKMGPLSIELESIARKHHGTIVMEGHLLCEIPVRNAECIVVREHLSVLERRLLKRRYSRSKIWENLLAEAMDYCGERSRSNYAHVYEVFSRESGAAKIIDMLQRRKHGKIELLEELVPFLKAAAGQSIRTR